MAIAFHTVDGCEVHAAPLQSMRLKADVLSIYLGEPITFVGIWFSFETTGWVSEVEPTLGNFARIRSGFDRCGLFPGGPRQVFQLGIHEACMPNEDSRSGRVAAMGMETKRDWTPNMGFGSFCFSRKGVRVSRFSTRF